MQYFFIRTIFDENNNNQKILKMSSPNCDKKKMKNEKFSSK